MGKTAIIWYVETVRTKYRAEVEMLGRHITRIYDDLCEGHEEGVITNQATNVETDHELENYEFSGELDPPILPNPLTAGE